MGTTEIVNRNALDIPIWEEQNVAAYLNRSASRTESPRKSAKSDP